MGTPNRIICQDFASDPLPLDDQLSAFIFLASQGHLFQLTPLGDARSPGPSSPDSARPAVDTPSSTGRCSGDSKGVSWNTVVLPTPRLYAEDCAPSISSLDLSY